MTDIPGTGILKIETPEIAIPEEKEVITVVNAKDLKKDKNDESTTLPENDLPYQQLKYWLIFGLGISLFFVAGAFLDKRSLFLIPLGPLTGAVAWWVRKFVHKHLDKFDAFSTK